MVMEAQCDNHGGTAACAQEEVRDAGSLVGGRWWRPAWPDPVAAGLPLAADGGRAG